MGKSTPISRPVDVATRETFEFLAAHLEPESRVLEVGCGKGEVAARLLHAGHDVVGLDSSAQALEAAGALGVSTRLARWPDFEDAPFDAIVFTRSLHHIPSLTAALEKAHALLLDGGLLLVEDFAFHEVDTLTAEWFFHQLRVLEALGCLETGHTFGWEVLSQSGAMAAWRHEHFDELHRAGDMEREMGKLFQLEQTNPVPYFYRYVIQMLAETETAGQVADRFLDLERHQALYHPATLIGRRWVARKASG